MRVPLPAAMITMSSAMSVFQIPKFRVFIITVLCSVLTLGAGCSMLRIGYSQAPELAFWWLDGYADFNSEQTPRVREALTQWFAWHRRTQLPDYAAQFARAQTEVLADTSAERVCAWQALVTQRAYSAFDRAVPAAADLMLTISAPQIQHIERRYAKVNAEFRDDYLQPSPAKRAAAAFKRTIDRAEMLYGTLDESQRARISGSLARSPFDPEVWLAERSLRQQEALQMLRQFSGGAAASREPAQAALRAYAQRMELSPREEYRRYVQRLAEFNCAVGADLHNNTNAAQRRNAAQKLAGWEADLRALASGADAGTSN